MIDISKYIEQIKTAVYGGEVRGSICDALETMATEASESVATAVKNATDSRESAKNAEQFAKAADGISVIESGKDIAAAFESLNTLFPNFIT